MLPVLLLIAISASEIVAQRPCGFKIAPCPSDMVCSRTDPSCTRGENCAGICKPGPYYNDMLPATPISLHLASPTPTPSQRGCGVPTTKGIYNCEAGEYCIDDPNRPAGSCGMSCDRPGICVKKPKPVPCGGRPGNNQCGPYEACGCTCDPECPPDDGHEGFCAGKGVCSPIDALPLVLTSQPQASVVKRAATTLSTASRPTAKHNGRGCGVRMVGGVYNCESDEKCIDDPRRPAGSCGMACDRPGVCVKKAPRLDADLLSMASQPKSTYTICGGRRKEQPCKKDEECVDKPETPGALAYDGPGICMKKNHQSSTLGIVPTSTPTYERKCGGMVPRGQDNSCRKDEFCIDDPRRPKGSCGLACDDFGICVKPVFCGGFAGFKCKDSNKMCIDDPRDDCDPQHGGADCGGICV